MAVGLREHRIVEHQILHAGFGVDIDAACLGRLDDVGALGRGHVDDVEPAAGDFGPDDGPLDRLGLDEVRPGDRRAGGAQYFFISSGVWWRAISSSSTRLDSAWTSSIAPSCLQRSSVLYMARSSDCQPSEA